MFVGLGNPGAEYQLNRHNVGFLLVDAFAHVFSFPSFKEKWKALSSKKKLGNQDVLLCKPQTFMNLSGEAVITVSRFYNVSPEHICVFHDDIDLPFGHIRFKKGGGHGGHNGLKSIDQHLGKEYWRFRFGVGHPGEKALVSSYVLSNFLQYEQKALGEKYLPEACDFMEKLVHTSDWSTLKP